MTIEQAIKHAREVAEERKDLCEDCRGEHLQLALWLEELKSYKDENERLTEEINQRRTMMQRMDCNYATELQKNAELQKQVDELTIELGGYISDQGILLQENARLDKNVKWFQEKIENGELVSEQAVKDAVNEILQEGKRGLSSSLRQWIIERFGLEVE